MLELTYTGDAQTVALNGTVPFNTAAKSCNCAERYRAGTSTAVLTKPGTYRVSASANIAVPTGGTVGPISVGIAIGGEVINGTIMEVTPAAVNEFFNVAASTFVTVYPGCCERITLRNTDDEAILVRNQNLIVTRVGGACYA